MIRAPAADATLDRIVRLLLERTTPELVVLFGSRADGTAHADSDYDFYLVVADAGAVESTRDAANAAMRGAGLSADVIVSSATEYERQQHDPGFLAWPVSRSGVLLHSTGRMPLRSRPPSHVREEPPTEGLAMWIRRAENDLDAAERLLPGDAPVRDAVCFHGHACVEKLLKALIIRSGAYPPRTHELKQLLAMQGTEVASNEALRAACTLLDELLPSSRYPDLPEPSLDDARRAIAAAREVRAFLGARLTG